MSRIKAFSKLQLKAVDEQNENNNEVTVEGLMTSPVVDRDNDIINPLGLEINTPFPLLLFHDHSKPVGEVVETKTTEEGVYFKAIIKKVQEEGIVKQRVDEAIHSLKYGLIKAVSIGFIGKEYVTNENGGVTFNTAEIIELSLVPIPANQDAVILNIKKYDKVIESNLENKIEIKQNKKQKTKQINNIRNKNMADLTSELIEKLESEIADLNALVDEYKEKLNAEDENGEEVEISEEEEAEVEKAIKNIAKKQKRLDMLKQTEKTKVEKATKTVSRNGYIPSKSYKKTIKAESTSFAFQCIVKAKGAPFAAEQFAERHFKENPEVLEIVKALQATNKAPVPAGSTQSGNWLNALSDPARADVQEFIELANQGRITDKFGKDGVPDLLRTSFNSSFTIETGVGNGYWTGEGNAKGLTVGSFDTDSIDWAKIACITVVTDEALNFGDSRTASIIRDQLIKAINKVEEITFLDPANAGNSATRKPASITNGSPSFASVDPETDFQSALDLHLANNPDVSSIVIIGDTQTALKLANLKNAMGVKEYPNMTINGGEIFGYKFLVTSNLPRDSDGGTLVFCNPSNIAYASDDNIQLDASREATLEMVDNPTQNSTTPTGATSMVNMFQTNSTAFRGERYVVWKKLKGKLAAVVVTGVKY